MAQTVAHRKVAELLTESTGTIPTPGFTIKTFKTRSDAPSSSTHLSIHKVFLNVCASPTIPPPPAWSPPPPSTPSYVLDYLKPCQGTASLSESDRVKAEEFLAIPLYFSQPRPDEDHQGQPCTVMDVILFPEALILAQDARPFKSFLIHLVLDQASTVLNDTLDPHFKLPKMRSKGTPAPFTWTQIQSRDPPSVVRPGVTQLEEIPDELLGRIDLSNYSVSYLGSPTVDCAQVSLQLDESLTKRLRQDPRLLHLSVSGYGDQLELAVHARPDSPDPIAKQTIPVCLGIDVKNSTAAIDSNKKSVTIRLCLCSYKSLNWV